MRQSTVTADHAPDAVQRLADGLEGAWRWWGSVAWDHTTSTLGRLAATLLLVWAVTYAVRLEIDRARTRARRRRRERLQVSMIERPAAGEMPAPLPPVAPPTETREDPGS